MPNQIRNYLACAESARRAHAEPQLTVGDTVLWRGAWGTDLPQEVVVTELEINTGGGKYGDDARSAPWSAITRSNAVVSLANGHWAYGDQIQPKGAS